MSFPITIRIYGTNTQPTASVINKSTLDADGTTYPYMQLTAYTINSSVATEDENKVDAAGRMRSKRNYRASFEIKVEPKALPTTASNLQTFYNTNVLNKKYHYLWFNDYTLPDSSCSSTQCLAVAITNITIEPNYDLGTKDVLINLSKLYDE